jgi:CheY-like chemotaxis protein/predicted regulator of Ras-like GTPase activity (Roadblock/LC7/MglB family)
MKRVLIVDDAIDVCRMLQDTLKTAYPEVRVSVMPSAEEALLEASRFTVDLLVADIRLPGMTGLELVRKIRIRQPQVKVILMTGMTLDERLTQQANEAAPDVFIRKPLHIDTFLDAVESLIGDREETPAARTVTPVPDRSGAGDPGQAAVLREIANILPGEPAGPPPPSRKATSSLRLPPEPPPAQEEQGISAVLSRLRGSLGAISAMLLDDRGRPVAQAGDLPDLSLEDQLFPAAMAAVSVGAKISYLIGQTALQSVQAYRGEAYDVVLAPVGQYVLLVVIRSQGTHLRLALAFEEALSAQVDLAAALEAMGLHLQSMVEMGAPEVIIAELEESQAQAEPASAESLEDALDQDPGLAKFEELLSKKEADQELPEDLDSFWEAASGEGQETPQPGVLSFEQAAKLGLVPKDADKDE